MSRIYYTRLPKFAMCKYRKRNENEYNEELKMTVYNPFNTMSFTYNHCFLCGAQMQNRKSVEHVFPKWLQQKYNLWSKKITLLNRTELPYRKLTIPCCKLCNTKHLSLLEGIVQKAHDKGYNSVINLDRMKLYQWVLKIFFGILFKELSLFLDRKNPEMGKIMESDVLERFKILYLFFQSVRLSVEFEDFNPYSIFIFKTHVKGDEIDFDYYDALVFPFFTIRMGEIGIIACLQDKGIIEEMFSDPFKKFGNIELHPIQFDELAAKIAYKLSLMNRNPKYILILPQDEKGTITVMSPPLQGLSTKPIFNEWNSKDFANVLLLFWSKYNLKFSDIFREPDLVLSMTENEDKSVILLDKNGNKRKP